jgi:hypothetical protein
MLLAVNPKFTTIANACKIAGLAYFGNVSHSAKLMKTQKMRHELTYGIYLAPAELSGRNICPGASEYCKAACLNLSGRARIETNNRIYNARIKKTKLFFAYNTFIMDWITAEIRAYKAKADRLGYSFSIRINCTSDLDISKYRNSAGLNVLEQFPTIQVYDYTKVFSRIKLLEKYPNYDLTYSYNGLNFSKCVAALNTGVRVAMVFEKRLPAYYRNIPVVNGDLYDIRYVDPKNAIVGLVFKHVRNKINLNNTPFVISEHDTLRSEQLRPITITVN